MVGNCPLPIGLCRSNGVATSVRHQALTFHVGGALAVESGPGALGSTRREQLQAAFVIENGLREVDPPKADAVLDDNASQFLRSMYRKNVPAIEIQPGMAFLNLAREKEPRGEPIMTDSELAVFAAAFESSGFTSSINWYRNLDRNWHLLADVNPIIQQPTLMIYGDRDPVAKSENLTDVVPNVDVVNLDCGHWIQQEKPVETNQTILTWLKEHDVGTAL